MALPVFVQAISANAGGVSSANLLFSSAVTAGNTIVFHVANNRSSGVGSVLDNRNAATYTQAIRSTLIGATNTLLDSWYSVNISSGAAASTFRVSFNFNQSQGYGAWVGEYSGVGAFSTTGSSQGTSTTVVPPAVTSSAASVLFSYCATYGNVNNFASTAGQGGTFRDLIDNANINQTLIVGDEITSSLTVQPSFTLNAAGIQWVCQMVAFPASTVAGAGVVNPFVLPLLGVQ